MIQGAVMIVPIVKRNASVCQKYSGLAAQSMLLNPPMTATSRAALYALV